MKTYLVLTQYVLASLILFTLGIAGIKLAQTNMGLNHPKYYMVNGEKIPCPCDACVAKNYPVANPDGPDYSK